MNLGFTVRPPAPPRVLAAPDQPPCGERFEDLGGISCERPYGHAGGHLCESRRKYWQARTPQAVA